EPAVQNCAVDRADRVDEGGVIDAVEPRKHGAGEDKECACQQTVGHSCNCEQRTEKRGHVADRSDRREEAVDRDVDRRVPIHSAITAWCEQPLLVRLIQLSEALCGTWP